MKALNLSMILFFAGQLHANKPTCPSVAALQKVGFISAVQGQGNGWFGKTWIALSAGKFDTDHTWELFVPLNSCDCVAGAPDAIERGNEILKNITDFIGPNIDDEDDEDGDDECSRTDKWLCAYDAGEGRIVMLQTPPRSVYDCLL